MVIGYFAVERPASPAPTTATVPLLPGLETAVVPSKVDLTPTPESRPKKEDRSTLLSCLWRRDIMSRDCCCWNICEDDRPNPAGDTSPMGPEETREAVLMPLSPEPSACVFARPRRHSVAENTPASAKSTLVLDFDARTRGGAKSVCMSSWGVVCVVSYTLFTLVTVTPNPQLPHSHSNT